MRLDQQLVLGQVALIWLTILAAYVSMAGAVGIAIGATILAILRVIQ